MPPSERLVAALALLSTLLLLETARLHGARWLAGLRQRARSRRAVRGERDAEKLLRRMGYRILARQVEERWAPTLDGDPSEIALRADLLVGREGRRFVAEVKTGEVAPSIQSAATRRQLLEYRMAFDVDGVLLVLPERGAVHAVDFPGAGGPVRPRSGMRVVLAFAAGAALGILAALVATT